MNDDTFQKYDFYHRAKAAFSMYNLVEYHRDWEDIVEDEVKQIENTTND